MPGRRPDTERGAKKNEMNLDLEFDQTIIFGYALFLDRVASRTRHFRVLSADWQRTQSRTGVANTFCFLSPCSERTSWTGVENEEKGFAAWDLVFGNRR